MKSKIFLLTITLLFTGCLNSNYHYGTGESTHKQNSGVHTRIKEINIGSISSSDFWKIGQKEYFEDALEDALRQKSDLRVVRRRTPYYINVDLRDYSSEAKEKTGTFLGQRQYRIVQNYDVSAWYRIEKRGERNTLYQGTEHYTPYADTASNKSFRDAREKVIDKKLKGIAKRVAMKVIEYFDVKANRW